MTYKEFLYKLFPIPEEEYNDLYPYINFSSFGHIISMYSTFSPIRFYDDLLNYNIQRICIRFNLDRINSTFNSFLYFKIENYSKNYPDEIKEEMLKVYYSLYNIYKKHHVDNISVKSNKNYYVKSILSIEPEFTQENITKLLQEFSDTNINVSLNSTSLNSCDRYNFLISHIFYHWTTECEFIQTHLAKMFLNKRKSPATSFEKYLLDEDFVNLTNAYNLTPEEYYRKNPTFIDVVIKIYNKFIYWFEINRSLTL